MKGNLLRIIAGCAVLGATIGFANAQNSWFRSVTHHHSQSDRIRDEKYMAGLRRHHEFARLREFEEREGYPITVGGNDFDRDQRFMGSMPHHQRTGRIDRFQDRESFREKNPDRDNRGLHKGWTKGRHNPHHGDSDGG